MQQVIQNLGSGETELASIPRPACKAGALLVRTDASLISLGTERMLVEFGQSNLLQKARRQPDKVKQVVGKIRTDGLLSTIDAVRSKLDQPIPLGYCNVGRVLEVGSGAEADFRVGDRVVSNGAHAEVVCIPKNLCASIPDGVSDEEAAFTVVGAIGLQGIRLIGPSLGETVVVTGLGLIGLIAVQILKAHGCRVLGIDFETAKCALAEQFGAETVDLSKGADPVAAAAAFSRGRGVDAVLITASTQSNEPVHQAATMCRKRGRIVLVGVVGLQLSRADFYEKELSFQVSCSYGPGRYDPEYEQKGYDYPPAFVRWTEQRNFEAILDLLGERRLDVRPLISHRFAFEQALQAYAKMTDRSALGIVLEYPAADTMPGDDEATLSLPNRAVAAKTDAAVVGVIGAGGFTSQVLLPALKATGARLKTIASAGGVTGTHLGKKFGFEQTSTDAVNVIADPEVNTVVITTRHNTHARYVIEALEKGKRVYVEKPLCLTEDELEKIIATYHASPAPFLMVGFNRRFAPQVEKMRELLQSAKEPRAVVVTVNAGAIPREHWIQDAEIGGGRVIGEACHFIDLLLFLVDAPIDSLDAASMARTDDTLSVTLRFADGSIGTLHYLANGNKAFPKERVEVFCGGRILQLNNFRELVGFGWKRFDRMKLWRQDKGHAAEMKALISAVRSGHPSPTPFDEIVAVTRATFDVVKKTRASQQT